MPVELIEDLSYGSSWLSFAGGSTATENRSAVAALRGETRLQQKSKNRYTGKTYNSSEAIAEFFKKRDPAAPAAERDTAEKSDKESSTRHSAFDRLKAAGSNISKTPGPKAEDQSFVAGSHVKHEKYGRGLVLRREGTGDNVKLTVSFPGFGQKKLIEKFAKLDKA
jgi:DNA helicase-2/ATP-dependent DNA helicase PcrA